MTETDMNLKEKMKTEFDGYFDAQLNDNLKRLVEARAAEIAELSALKNGISTRRVDG